MYSLSGRSCSHARQKGADVICAVTRVIKIRELGGTSGPSSPPDDLAHLGPKPRVEAFALRESVRSGACDMNGPT